MDCARLLFVSSERAGVWPLPGVSPGDTSQVITDLPEWFAWRLIGGNNREIARSGQTFGSFQACLESARSLQGRIDATRHVVRHDDLKRLWAWRVAVDGRLEAVCGRLYQRHRECLSSLAQFRSAMPTAHTVYDSLDVSESRATAGRPPVPAQRVRRQLTLNLPD